MHDPYWTLDTALFEGTFRYFGKEPVLVRGKVHRSEERYSLRPAERTIEPVKTLRGARHYIHMKPFVLLPDMVFTIGLYSQQREDQAIGEVIAAQARKPREIEIGQAQAWYYPQDTLIVLWECFFHDFVRDVPLLEDSNMKALWESFTQFLLGQFPAATRITTPWHDPIFENEEYRVFLRSLGYEQVAKAAFGKSIEQS